MTSLIPNNKLISLADFANLISLKAADQHQALIGYFYGDFGSGKTFVISALIKQLTNYTYITAPSPSYGLIHFYQPNIYHCDFYRINSLNEIESTGIIDQLYEPNTILLIEWGSILENCDYATKPCFKAYVSLDHRVSIDIDLEKCNDLNKLPQYSDNLQLVID